LEVLFADSTFIDAWLSREPRRDGQLEWIESVNRLDVDDFLERVVEDVVTGDLE